MAILVIIYQTIKSFMFEVESLALIHIVNKKKLANTRSRILNKEKDFVVVDASFVVVVSFMELYKLRLMLW